MKKNSLLLIFCSICSYWLNGMTNEETDLEVIDVTELLEMSDMDKTLAEKAAEEYKKYLKDNALKDTAKVKRVFAKLKHDPSEALPFGIEGTRQIDNGLTLLNRKNQKKQTQVERAKKAAESLAIAQTTLYHIQQTNCTSNNPVISGTTEHTSCLQSEDGNTATSSPTITPIKKQRTRFEEESPLAQWLESGKLPCFDN